MIDTLKRAATFWAPTAIAAFVIASPAFSQAPSDAQRAAIKSQCRSDYIAHCSSVPPGGVASLQCLKKNMSSLSSSCQTAVRAVDAPAETKAETKEEPKKESKSEPSAAAKQETKAEPAPAAAPAKPAAEPAAAPVPKAAASAAVKKPSSAQTAAIRSACRSDYPKVCAGVPTGGAAALQCLEKNKSRVTPRCQTALAAVSGGSAAAAGAPATSAAASPTAPAAAPAAPAAPALMLRPMRPREVLFVLRSACGADVHALCPGISAGGGRILQCLAARSAALSPDCRGVLGQFAAQ